MAKLEPYRNKMEGIAFGTPTINTLRHAAALTGGNSGWHSGPLWLGALLAEPFSGTAAATLAALPFAGLGLKKLAGKLTDNKVDALKNKIGGNAVGLPPLPSHMMNTLRARALMATLATNGASTGQQ